jgi:hypothetical protein
MSGAERGVLELRDIPGAWEVSGGGTCDLHLLLGYDERLLRRAANNDHEIVQEVRGERELEKVHSIQVFLPGSGLVFFGRGFQSGIP